MAAGDRRAAAADRGGRQLHSPHGTAACDQDGGSQVIEGRWLRPDTDALVINHVLLSDRKAGIKPGDRVAVKVGDRSMTSQVVGVAREVGAARRGMGTPAYACVDLDALSRLMGSGRTTNLVYVAAADKSDAAPLAFSRQLESRFDAAGPRRMQTQLTVERKTILQEHLVVIVAFLLLMAALVAGVGGLALAAAISIGMKERTREIGMMRAVGASSHAVLKIIVTEGVVVGLLSWVVALAVAVPVSVAVGNVAGQTFIESYLDNVFAPLVMLGWLALVILISLLASSFPAWSATRLAIRNVLACE